MARFPAAAAAAAATLRNPLTLLLATLLVAGCNNKAKDPVGESVVLPTNSFAVEWRAETPVGRAKLREIYVNEDRVMAVADDNKCYFLNRVSGHVTQITQAGNPQDNLLEPVTITDAIIFPSTNNLTVCDRTGKVRHRIKLRYGASSGAAGDDERVYLGLDSPSGGRLSAIEHKAQPYDVTPLWELLTRGQVASTPAVFQGAVYAGSRDGGVYAVRGDNREVLWPGLEGGYFKTGGEILADVKADKDGVYVASMDTKLYCLDANTGRVKWRYYAGSPMREYSSPVVTGDTVYTFLPQNGLVAIDKSAQAEIRPAKWTLNNARQFLAHDERHVYVRMMDNRIVAVDKASGQPRFASTRRDFVTFAVNDSDKDNTIYAATANGTVYAIRPVLKPGDVGELVVAE